MEAVSAGEADPRRRENDEQDVDQTDDVPDADGAKTERFTQRDERDEQGENGHDDVTDSTGHRERVRQFAATVEYKEVNSDEARQVQEYECAHVEAIDPGAERPDLEIGENE